MTYWFRILVSALVVAGLGFGAAIQMALAEGRAPTRYEVWSASVAAGLLALNDIKSRLTPTARENN